MARIYDINSRISQEDLNFEAETMYTIRFNPINPVPRVGWIKLIYPKTIKIKDQTEFIKAC
jgi:hypothetical protein